nr:hypothetical protein [Tanacetum cinerariifolium]
PRGAIFCGREWGEVVGSSWSSGGVVRMREKEVAGCGGKWGTVTVSV